MSNPKSEVAHLNEPQEDSNSTSYDIERDSDLDIDDVKTRHNELNEAIMNDTEGRSCSKISHPHIFQLYMFSNSFLSPGTFAISSSNKYYWQRTSESHAIPLDALETEISALNRCVFWYMFVPKLLWIIPWLCLPIGVVIYAVEDGFEHDHPSASASELKYHLYWSYNGLFLFVGGGIGGVLLATQLWSHCWYLAIQAMAKKINDLNSNDLWLNQYCVNFDIQCDIPVLAGRSYGRAYYKIVITMHHEYLNTNGAFNNNASYHPSEHLQTPPVHTESTVVSLKLPPRVRRVHDRPSRKDILSAMEPPTRTQAAEQKEEFEAINSNEAIASNIACAPHVSEQEVDCKIKRVRKHEEDRKSCSAFLERPKLMGRTPIMDGSSSSLFNVGGFVSKSVLNDTSTRTSVHQTKVKKRDD